MAGGLDGKLAGLARRVQLDALVNDVLIASLETKVFKPQGPFQELRQLVGGDRIGNHGGSRRLLRHYDAQKGDQGVPVDRHAVGEYHGGPVTVAVEDDAQVGMMLQRGLLNGLHGSFVFRVRDMVREGSVGVKELASFGVCAQGFENIRCKEAGSAVAGVHRDAESREGLFFIRTGIGADNLLHMLAVEGLHIEDGDGAIAHRKFIGSQQCLRGFFGEDSCQCGCLLQNLRQLCLGQSAVLCKKLHAVPVEGKVACGDHHGAVEITSRKNGGAEHGGGGDEAAVVCLCHREAEQASRLHLRRGHELFLIGLVVIQHVGFAKPFDFGFG